MDDWLVLTHVAAVLGLMLAHGVHATVMWRFRGEPDPERALAFFEVVPSTALIRTLLAVVVLTGVAAGYARSSWGQGWIWTSLVLLAAIGAAATAESPEGAFGRYFAGSFRNRSRQPGLQKKNSWPPMVVRNGLVTGTVIPQTGSMPVGTSSWGRGLMTPNLYTPSPYVNGRQPSRY